jgi:hypothetical protein
LLLQCGQSKTALTLLLLRASSHGCFSFSIAQYLELGTDAKDLGRHHWHNLSPHTLIRFEQNRHPRFDVELICTWESCLQVGQDKTTFCEDDFAKSRGVFPPFLSGSISTDLGSLAKDFARHI